jgi:hypothetical protein
MAKPRRSSGTSSRAAGRAAQGAQGCISICAGCPGPLQGGASSLPRRDTQDRGRCVRNLVSVPETSRQIRQVRRESTTITATRQLDLAQSGPAGRSITVGNISVVKSGKTPGQALGHPRKIIGVAATAKGEPHGPIESPQASRGRGLRRKRCAGWHGAPRGAWPSTGAGGPVAAESGQHPAQAARNGTSRASRGRPCRAAGGIARTASARRPSSPANRRRRAPLARGLRVVRVGSRRTRATKPHRPSIRQDENGRTARRPRRG